MSSFGLIEKYGAVLYLLRCNELQKSSDAGMWNNLEVSVVKGGQNLPPMLEQG